MFLLKERIKELRKEMKLNQSALASAVNFSQNAISSWEKGKRLPNVPTIIILAKFFNVSTDYLLGLED